MNEDQCYTTSTEVDVSLNTENNATTNTFDIDKDASYESVRNIFVPNLEKSIYEGRELLSKKNSTKSSLQGFNKCLEVATNVENPLIECEKNISEKNTGILDRIIKPLINYLVKEGLINGLINSVVISNRINKISKNIHIIKTGQNIDEWSLITNDDNYSEYTGISESTDTFRSSNCPSICIENGSESETIINEFSDDLNDNDNKINTKNNLRVIVDSVSSVIITPKASNEFHWKSVGTDEEKIAENCCKNEDEKKSENKIRKLGTKVDWKDKDVTVVISNSSNSLERNKSSLPCNCENRLREIIKTDSSQSGSQLAEQQKMLEIAMQNTCFTLDDIYRKQINYDRNNCQLLRKWQEKYNEITIKLRDGKYTDGSMTNLYIDRIKAYEKDSDNLQKPSTSLKVDEPEDDDNNKNARINSTSKVILHEKINFPSKDGIIINKKSEDVDVKGEETSFFSGIRDKDISTSTKIADDDFEDNKAETFKECNSENSCDCSDSENSGKIISGDFENCSKSADNRQMFSNDDKNEKQIDDKKKIDINKKMVDFGNKEKKPLGKSDISADQKDKSKKKMNENKKFREVRTKAQNYGKTDVFADKSKEKINDNKRIDNEEMKNKNDGKHIRKDMQKRDKEKDEVTDFSDADDISILGFKRNVEYYGKRRSISTQTLTNFEMFKKNSFISNNSKHNILEKFRAFEALKTILEENEGKICSCNNVDGNYDYDEEEGKIMFAEEYTLDDHDKMEDDSSNLNHAVSQVNSTISLAPKITQVIPDVVEENIKAEPENKCDGNYDDFCCDIDDIESTPERKREIENLLKKDDSDEEESRDKNKIRSYSSRNLLEILADGQNVQSVVPDFVAKANCDRESSENCHVIIEIDENKNNSSREWKEDAEKNLSSQNSGIFEVKKLENSKQEDTEIKGDNFDATTDKFKVINQRIEKSTDLGVKNEIFEFRQQEVEIRKSDHRKSGSSVIEKDEFEVRKREVRKSADFGAEKDDFEFRMSERKKSADLNIENGDFEVRKKNSVFKNNKFSDESNETNVFQQEIEEKNHNLQIPSKENPKKKQNLLKKKSDIENVNKDDTKSSYKRYKNPSPELTESIKRRTSFSYEQERKSDHNCEYFYLLDEIEETNKTSTPERKRDIDILLKKDYFPLQDLTKNKQKKYSNGKNGQAQKLAGVKKNRSSNFQYDLQKMAPTSDCVFDDSKFSRFSRNTSFIAQKFSDNKKNGELVSKPSKTNPEKDQNKTSDCHELDNISVCKCSDTDSEKFQYKISAANTLNSRKIPVNKYQSVPRKRSRIKTFISAFCRKVRKFFSIFFLRKFKSLLKKNNNKSSKDVKKGFNITENFCESKNCSNKIPTYDYDFSECCEPKNCFNKIPTCDDDFSEYCGSNSCLNKAPKNYNSITSEKKVNENNHNNKNKNGYKILKEETSKDVKKHNESEKLGSSYHQPVYLNSSEFACNGAAYNNTCCKDQNNSRDEHWVELPIINSYNSIEVSSTSCDCDQAKKLMYHRKYARRKSLEEVPLNSTHKKYKTRRKIKTRRRSDFSLFKSNREPYPCCYYKSLAAEYLAEYLNFRLRLHHKESDSDEAHCKECLESTDSELKSLLNEYIKTSRRERRT